MAEETIIIKVSRDGTVYSVPEIHPVLEARIARVLKMLAESLGELSRIMGSPGGHITVRAEAGGAVIAGVSGGGEILAIITSKRRASREEIVPASYLKAVDAEA